MKFIDALYLVKEQSQDSIFFENEMEELLDEKELYPEKDMEEYQKFVEKQETKKLNKLRSHSSTTTQPTYVKWVVDNKKGTYITGRKRVNLDDIQNFADVQDALPDNVKKKFDKVLDSGRGSIYISFGNNSTNIGIRQVLSSFKDAQGNYLINGVLVRDNKKLQTDSLENVVKAFDENFLNFQNLFTLEK